MKRALFLFCLFTFPNLVFAEEINDSILEGEWSRTFMQQEESCLPAQEYIPPMPADNKWVIKGDSIAFYAYPTTFLGKYRYSVKEDSLFVSTEYRVQRFHFRQSFFALFTLENGVLTLFTPECITMKFRRDTFDHETARLIAVLNRDSLNPYLLVGKYSMITHFVPDDEAAYDEYPPVKMKSIITIKDTVAARRLIHEGVLMLSVNGTLQQFHIVEINWHSWHSWQTEEFHCEPEIVIAPGHWWKGESFRVHYQLKEADQDE